MISVGIYKTGRFVACEFIKEIVYSITYSTACHYIRKICSLREQKYSALEFNVSQSRQIYTALSGYIYLSLILNFCTHIVEVL